MRIVLGSRRRRRRAAWVGGTALMIAALVMLGIRFSNTGHRVATVYRRGPVARVAPNPKADPFTPAERRQVRAVATHFIRTAVYREHIDDSWAITTATLRQGMTRKAWAAGVIPVVPYPGDAVAEVRYRVNYSYAKTVGMMVAIYPKPHAGIARQLFDIELQNTGNEEAPRWLVSRWSPSGGPQLAAAAPGGPPIRIGTKHGSIRPVWLLAPVGLIIGTLLTLIGWLSFRGWLRANRAEKAHLKSLEL